MTSHSPKSNTTCSVSKRTFRRIFTKPRSLSLSLSHPAITFQWISRCRLGTWNTSGRLEMLKNRRREFVHESERDIRGWVEIRKLRNSDRWMKDNKEISWWFLRDSFKVPNVAGVASGNLRIYGNSKVKKLVNWEGNVFRTVERYLKMNWSSEIERLKRGIELKLEENWRIGKSLCLRGNSKEVSRIIWDNRPLGRSSNYSRTAEGWKMATLLALKSLCPAKRNFQKKWTVGDSGRFYWRRPQPPFGI